MKKKLISVLLTMAILLSVSIPVGATSVADFTDVQPGAWYYRATEYAVENNLFSGTSETTFSPNKPMTRGMFVTVLGRKAGVDKNIYSTCRFTDVKKSEYYAPYAEWAATYGIVSGTSATEFSPNKAVTREQMAVILYHYAKATENDVGFAADTYERFPDAGKVSNWAKEAFQWATSKGIINGSNGKLDPSGTATRAQVAQVFLSAKDVLIKSEITSVPIPTPVPTPTPTPTPAPTPKPDIDAVVYWVSGGKVYHSTDKCPALARSTNIKAGTVEQAIAAGKKNPCKDCH